MRTHRDEARRRALAPHRKPRVAVPVLTASDGVPRIIHQAFHTRQLPPELADSLAAIRGANPDWRHQFYDDGDIRRFIHHRYGSEILGYFDAINPKYRAARSDLFRYLVIYSEGGVYLDAKSLPTRPLSEVIRSDDQYLISQWDNGEDGDYPGWGVHRELARIDGGEFQQWYIAAAAGHAFLRAVLQRVFRNLRNYNPGLHGVGQRGVLRVTGPIPYTLAIHPLLGRYPHRVVDSWAELGFAYSIYGKEGHKQAFREAFGNHYSELSEPITPVGAATRAASTLIASLKKVRRVALGLPGPGAQAV